MIEFQYIGRIETFIITEKGYKQFKTFHVKREPFNSVISLLDKIANDGYLILAVQLMIDENEQ